MSTYNVSWQYFERPIVAARRGDGAVPFDLLAGGAYERVLSMLGSSSFRRASPASLTPRVRATRAPIEPANLIDALQDRIHRDSGKVRIGKSVRIRGDDQA